MPPVDSNARENIAETLARVLPQPIDVATAGCDMSGEALATKWVALPQGYKVEKIDFEHLLAGPRLPKLLAEFNDADSFLAYVNSLAPAPLTDEGGRPRVWASFDPAKGSLYFEAVLDDHGYANSGWRRMRAVFKPRLSHEWSVWSASNRQAKEQLTFAEFLEENQNDIHAASGMPTAPDMLQMATSLTLNSDKRLKSTVRLQGGGVAMEYVDDANADTIERMRLFEKFALALPVFWEMPGERPIKAYPLQARLKWRQAQGEVKFHYELIRPDRVFQQAGIELIEKVCAGLGSIPLVFGMAD